MPDSPRDRMQRTPNRMNRPHAGQSVDPTLTRKGALAHPGSLFIGFGALVFFAYVFDLGGLQKWLDGLFGGLDRTARSHNNEVATWVMMALPYVGVALGALVLFLIVSALGRGAKTVTKRHKLGKREEVSLDGFVEAAAQHSVSKKVAREAYQILLPYYDNHMRVTLSDTMTTTLHMKPADISDLYGNLLRRTDRQRTVGDTGAQIDTVLDLLTEAEKSTVRSLTQSKLHQRAEREANAPVRKRVSLGHRVKQSLLRSVIRQAAPAAVAKPKVIDPSVIKPYRPARKEAEVPAEIAPPQTPIAQ